MMQKLQLDEISERYQRLSVKKELLEKDLKRTTLSLRIANRKLKNHEEARVIFTTLSKQIQKQAKEYIEKITTMAIQTIFDRPFTYHLIFEEKRNTMTCTPLVKLEGEEYDPKEDQGGGFQDILGFIQKIVLWSIQVPRSINTLVFDEPFRFCGDLTLKAALMVQKLSEKLGLQIIIITHESELADVCDRVWKITMPKNRSVIRRIK